MTAILALVCLLSVQIYNRSAPPTTTAASPGSAQPADSSAAAAAAPAATGDGESDGFWSWFSSAPPPPQPETETVKIDENLFDPRAATRVSSFSCAGALSASRERVCSNWGLAVMDYNMSLLVQSAMSQGSSAKSVHAAQKTFERELDRLGGNVNKVREHYRQRIDQLSKQI